VERMSRIVVTDTIDAASAGAWRKAPRYSWREDVRNDESPSTRWWLTFPPRPTLQSKPRSGARFLREFVDLGRNRSPARMRSAILRYANRVGDLGESLTVITPDGSELRGEPFELWVECIEQVETLLRLLNALRALYDPAPAAARAALWDHLSVAPGAVTLMLSHAASFTLRGDDAARASAARDDDAALEWAVKHCVLLFLTRLLRERLSVAVSLDPPGLQTFPASLLAALRFEVLRQLVRGRGAAPQKQCPQCHEWFQPKTRAQVYCSIQHQQLFNYHKSDRKQRRRR